MTTYALRRLLLVIPTLLVLSFVIFALADLIPGDVISAMEAVPGADGRMDREALEKELGLDASLFVQYARWMGIAPQPDGARSGVLQGDFGVSWWTRNPVVDLMLQRWPVTIELGLLGIVMSLLIALPIGITSAIRQGHFADYAGRSLAILFISVPSFWVGTLALVLPSIWWGHMPALMYTKFTSDPIANLQMVLLPAAVLGMGLAGLTMRMTRTMMLEVLRQDYIRTAWAKGLRERVIIVRHAVKNALIPVVTIIGLQLPVVFGGTVIIEQIFSLPGMGRLILEAVLHRDQPLVAGGLLILAVILVLINLAVDLFYALLDPRIHYE